MEAMANHLIDQFRVKPKTGVRLQDFDSNWTGDHEDKEEAEALVQANLQLMSESQQLLWASARYSLLIVLQAMDAAGKDGLIKHVMSGVNPQGCEVHAFRQPSAEELAHPFLWRYSAQTPSRGRIGILNRSYYEEVLVVRVHPEWIEKQNIPDAKPGHKLWEQRYDDINAFERHLTRNGVVVLKFFLNVSKKVQTQRLLARLEDPGKHWKFSAADLAERAYWDEYMKAYQDALSATSTQHSPWYVIPADHKWVSHWIASEILVRTIQSLDLKPPKPTKAQEAEVRKALRELKKR
jgi:PPK2 family polyphosphate:nucleotide phosphotransferase